MAITRLGPNNSTNISGVNLTSQVTGTLPTGNGGTGATSFAPGKVLQVINSENAYATSTTASGYTDMLSSSGTTWETAITPSATSSKILVITSIMIYWEENGNSNNRGDPTLNYKVGSGSYSQVQSGQIGNYDYGGNGVQSRNRLTFNYLISPNTTSAVTIKFTYNSAGGCTGVVNDGGDADSNVTLFEVGA